MKTLINALRYEADRRNKQAAKEQYPLDAFIHRQIAESLFNVADETEVQESIVKVSPLIVLDFLDTIGKEEAKPRKTAEVMNGQVGTGDTIVYPGRWASSLWTNIATVLEVLEVPARPYMLYPETKTALRVEVVNTTGYADTPYRTIIHVLDRVVKL